MNGEQGIEGTRRRILLVEDDQTMALGLAFNLEEEGYETTHCPDGESGLAAALGGGYDLVVLDMLLPGKSGLDVLVELRSYDVRTPVLILSASASSDSIVDGLNGGADDYLTKPFDLDVLLARIKSLIRSRQWLGSGAFGETNRLRLGGGEVDFRSSRFHGPNGEVDLSYKESMLLKHLSGRLDQPVPREELLREVWGYTDGVQTRTLDTFVLNLRKKIEPNPKKPRHLITVPGTGYLLRP